MQSFSDFLSKNFNFDHSVKTIHKSNDLKLETSATSGANPMLSHVKANFEVCGGKSEVKITANGKDKDTNFKYEVPNLPKGVDLTVSGNATQTVTLETNYKPLDMVGTKFEFCTDFGSKKDLLASANVSSNGVKVTADTNIDCGGGALKDYNFKVDYKHGDNLVFALKTADQRSSVTASVAQQFCKSVYWGAQVEHNTKDSSTTFQAGTKMAFNGGTAFAKINCGGNLCLSAEHVLSNPAAKVNVAGQFNLLESNPANAKAFGVGLTFGDF
jgi:hypothetical protein